MKRLILNRTFVCRYGRDAMDRIEGFLGRRFSDRSPEERIRAASLFIVLVLFLATVLVFILDGGPRGDIVNFYGYAMAMKGGEIPYVDFEYEFPPASLLFFMVPALFTSDLTVYYWIFGLMSAAFMSAAVICVMRMAPSEGSGYLAALLFVVLILLYLTESVKKFDSIPMSLTAISLYLFSKGRWSWSYGFMAVASFTKLYPCLFLPLMVAYNLFSEKGGRDAVGRGVLSCAAVLSIVFLSLWSIGVSPAEALSFLGFHGDRGFQTESTMATVMELLGLLGLSEIQIVDAHNTYDVIGPIADALATYWTYVISAVVIAALVFCFRYLARSGGERGFQALAVSMLLVCAAFMLINKVFSTQYMMWLFPLLAMLLFLPEANGREKKTIGWIALMQILCIVILRSDIGSWVYVSACAGRDIIMIAIVCAAVMIMIGRGFTIGRRSSV